MAIRFEDKARDAKPARKEVGGKAYVAEEPAATPSDPAPAQAAAGKKRPVRSKPGSA